MRNIPFLLLVALMMMPQISETLYSPALPSISWFYSVASSVAAQTLSVYFFAFAFGVVCWGMACDRFGRRKTMLTGLGFYCAGALAAVFSPNFACLLGARILCAFGAAVGSVGTQTMMRDLYSGSVLSRSFAIMGIALSISPVIGMVSGGFLVMQGGAVWVFYGQIAMALLLLLWSSAKLVETQDGKRDSIAIKPVVIQLFKDVYIWRIAILVALFNIMLYSFYAIAPFLYHKIGFDSIVYGASGFIMAAGGLVGAWFNHRAVKLGISLASQLLGAIFIVFMAAIMFIFFKTSLLIVMPSFLLPVAYGLAIPALLSHALPAYKHAYGIAGAFLGLLYYLLIALGLGVAAGNQNIEWTLFVSATLAILLSIKIPMKA